MIMIGGVAQRTGTARRPQVALSEQVVGPRCGASSAAAGTGVAIGRRAPQPLQESCDDLVLL
jgi:hypothetical protein